MSPIEKSDPFWAQMLVSLLVGAGIIFLIVATIATVVSPCHAQTIPNTGSLPHSGGTVLAPSSGTTSDMRVLVCGGRGFSGKAGREKMHGELSALSPTEIIQGGATGADHMARMWAKRMHIPCRTFDAEWDKYGLAAGPLRNQQMLEEGNPDLVLAFPGGAGTRDMVERAEAAGVPVKRVDG